MKHRTHPGALRRTEAVTTGEAGTPKAQPRHQQVFIVVTVSGRLAAIFALALSSFSRRALTA